MTPTVVGRGDGEARSWRLSWLGAAGVIGLAAGLILLSQSREDAAMRAREANLKGLGNAMAVYMAECQDRYPNSLAEFLGQGENSDSSHDALERAASHFADTSAYVYLRSGATKKMWGEPLIAERPDRHPADSKLMVLDRDGHVELRGRADVEAMIEKQ